MKLSNVLLLFTVLTNLSLGYAGQEGGGGDASEVGVNVIREDLLKWIQLGGAKNLNLPEDITYEHYVGSMTGILQPKKVIIEFTNEAVLVNNVEKTCKGFLQGLGGEPHIRCNIYRYGNTAESEQYMLIHHEFAGLVRIEKNSGAASDYFISKQITNYLVKESVYRLAVKPKKTAKRTQGGASGPVSLQLLADLFERSEKIYDIESLKPQKELKRANKCYSAYLSRGADRLQTQEGLITDYGNPANFALTFDEGTEQLVYYWSKGSANPINTNASDLQASAKVLPNNGKELTNNSSVEFARNGTTLLAKSPFPGTWLGGSGEIYLQCPQYFKKGFFGN